MKGIDKLYSGDYNYGYFEKQSDGSVIITLSKDGEDKIYRIRVRRLYEEDEEVLSDEEIQTKIPPHIAERQRKAVSNLHDR